MRACVLGLVSCLATSAVLAQQPAPPQSTGQQPAAGTPDVATLLFETPQWAKAPVGATLTYAYDKQTPAAFGPNFKDTIALKLEKSDDPQSRTVNVRMFSGDHVKPAGPFQSDQQNPVLLLALEANLEDLARTWHGNPRYLKDAIRKAWRDDAKIEKTQIQVDGKPADGARITIQPFRDDPEKQKMNGLESMVYTVEVSDSVPGYIATVDVHGPATGPTTFTETLRFQSEATK